MILDILLGVFTIIIGFFIAPLSALPDATLDPNLQNAVVNVQGFIATVNPLFPIDTLALAIGTIVSIELAILTYKAIYWLIKKIPTIS